MSNTQDFPELKPEELGLFSIENNSEIKNMNFSQYKSKVNKDLSELENRIISELLINDHELVSMYENFTQSEGILSELESSLNSFKDKLENINSDMKQLQVKSNEISVKLKNRKEFEEELYSLLDSIVLSPDFLNDVSNKEIDDEYIEKLYQLDAKLDMFNKEDLPQSKAIYEVIPEMQKTLTKVSGKIYCYLMNKFQLFLKPNTNIKIIQDVIVSKNKFLITFLKKHSISMYQDIVSKYISYIEKIYSSSTITYIQEVSQFVNDKPEKQNLISSDDYSKELSSQIEKRLLIISQAGIEETSILPIIAKQKQIKYYYEEVFRSMNKFLMDMVLTELVFFNDFFEMNPSQSCTKLNELFKSSLNNICDFLKRQFITKTNDIITIIIMIIVNFEQSKLMNHMGSNHLDFYFEGFSSWLWIRFDEIFNKYNENIFKNSYKQLKYINHDGIHVSTYKISEILYMICILAKHLPSQTPMLQLRIKQVQKNLNSFLSEVVDLNKALNGFEREEKISIFFINNLYYILERISKSEYDSFLSYSTTNDYESFDNTYNDKVEVYMNIVFKKYFEDISKIVNFCLVKSENNVNDNNKNKSTETVFESKEISKLNKKDLSIICTNFNSKYKDLIDKIKNEVFIVISSKPNAGSVFKRLIQEILIIKYYHFLEILKVSRNEDLISTTVSYSRFMIEMNTKCKEF